MNNMLNLHWIEIILLLGAAQGLFLSMGLSRLSDRNTKATKILAWLLFCTSTMLVGRIVYLRYDPEWLYQLTLIPDTIIFLFGPLLYLLVQRMLYETEPANHWYLFIPAVLHLLGVAYFMQYDNATYRYMAFTGTLFYYYNIVEGSAIVLNIAYFMLSLGLIKKYQKTTPILTSGEGSWYLIVIIILLAMALGGWLFSYCMSLFYQNPSYYDLVWIIIPCVTFLVSHYAIGQPEMFKVTMLRNGTTPTFKIGNVQRIKEKLEFLMMHDKLYEKPKLSLQELAQETQLSTNQISWILNHEYKCNFYDFVNEYRIKAFIQKLNEDHHQTKTLLALAFEVGFNSKTTFNKSFKKVMRHTPREYLNSQLTPA